MTPRELFLVVEAYNAQRELTRRDMVTQAYLMAAWSRASKLPKLESILKKSESVQTPKRAKSAEEMLQFVKMIQAESEAE